MNLFPALVSQNKGNPFFVFLFGKDVFPSSVVFVDVEVLSFGMNKAITRFKVSKFIYNYSHFLFDIFHLRSGY